MKNINPLYLIKENIAIGAGLGAMAGGGFYAIGEWYAKFLKDLIIVIKNAESPLQVKKWFNENIIQNNDIFTRRRFLDPGMDSHGYVDKRTGVMTSVQMKNKGLKIQDAINSAIENNTDNWKEMLLKFCKKELYLHRVALGVGAVGLGIGGAALGALASEDTK